MPKWARILIRCGIATCAIGVYAWLFGLQTALAVVVRSKFRDIPEAAMTPVALTDISVSSAAHKKVSYFGYEFELPWDDVDEQKSKTFGTVRLTAFRSGNAFWFSAFPARDFVDEVKKDLKLDPLSFRQVFGDEESPSDYAFHRTLLGVTPRQISPFMPQRRAVTMAVLLTIKVIAMPKADTGLFSVHAKDLQGFQFGDPRKRPPRVSDELYGSDGGLDLIFFQSPSGTGPAISQPEINRVLQSLHKVSFPASANKN